MDNDDEDADVLIVGARCAGSALAMHLLRKKKTARVIVVDSCSMPSDQPISTHFIGCYGMRELDLLGLGDKVRKIAPPVPNFINAVDGKPIVLPFPPEGQGSCIRRSDLDPMLVEAARAAGADVRLRTKVVALSKNPDGRVVGAVVQDAQTKKKTTIRAPLVVGADGRHSFVAKAVNATEYDGYNTERAFYWAYFKRPESYSTNPNYQGGAAITWFNREIYFVFPTNTDQLLIGCGFPKTELSSWRGRQRETLLERLRANDFIAPLAKGDPIDDELHGIRGVLDMRFYFRQAAGPGWALVGDAGLHKDPAPGLGISDAFRDAHALADAIDEGTDEALTAYWRQRDVASHELFHFAKDLGDLDYNTAFTRLLFKKAGEHAWVRDSIVKLHTRELEPSTAFSFKHIVKWTVGALLRGNFAVLPPFLKAGKRGRDVAKAKAVRLRLAADAAELAMRAKKGSIHGGKRGQPSVQSEHGCESNPPA
jgi:menaquinone-9 beta-reductase